MPRPVFRDKKMSSSMVWCKQGESPSLVRQNTHSSTGKNEQLVIGAAQQLREREQALRLTRAHTIGQGLRGFAQYSATGVGDGIRAAMKGPIDGYQRGGRKGVLYGALNGVSAAGQEISGGFKNACEKLAEGYTNHVMPDKKLFGTSRKARGACENAVLDDIMEIYRRERILLYDGLDEMVLDTEPENSDANSSLGDGIYFEPKHTEFYEVLGCPPDASQREIRKAYIARAQSVHPDKNPGDPESQANFVQLCQAYHTVSDSARREEYDRYGFQLPTDDSASNSDTCSSTTSSKRTGKGKVNDLVPDPMTIFDVMFGNNMLVHIMGDMSTSLMFLAQADVGGIKSLSMHSSEGDSFRIQGEMFQEDRRVWLAELLCRRLQPFVDGDEQAVFLHAHHEVMAVREKAFGADLLRAIGSVYAIAARAVLSRSRGPLRSAMSHLESKAERVALRAALAEASAVDSVLMPDEESDQDGETPSFEHRYQASLSRVWTVAKWDIQQTIRA